MEILKGRARHIKQATWRKPLERYVELIERVNKSRNIACHSQMIVEEGKFVFFSSQAAKLFKGLKLEGVPTVERLPLEAIASKIPIGEQALGIGENLIENFRRVQAEIDRRKAVPQA